MKHFEIPTDAVAYSYLRFSHPDQIKGDSQRRQADAAAEWCKRNRVRLDTSLALKDLGASAFKGKHRDDKHDLGKFLKLVQDGRVPKGAYFIIENLDRLSREDERKALRLWMDILDAGVNIVQLTPETIFRHEKSDRFDIMRAIMELSRGHHESVVKSERVGAAWEEKKRRARNGETQKATKRMGEGCHFVTRRLPAWIRERGGKLVLDRARAAVVRHVFDLAINGYGLALIVKKLIADGVEPWGIRRRKRGTEETYLPKWSKAYVHKILAGRAVLGEYQPMKDGKPDGPAIKGYYPAVFDDEGIWDRAQAALAVRKEKPGRVSSKTLSLFSGLLWDARTQSRMLVAWQTRGGPRRRQKFRALVSADSMEGRCETVSFPYQVFEDAILGLFREINPADVRAEEPAAESVALTGELAGVEQRMRRLEDELTEGGADIPALVRAMKTLEEKRQDLLRRRALAQQKEANPPGAAWAEAQTLLDVAQDEAARLRLRALLRIIIASMYILVVRRRSWRLAAVQIHFAECNRRDYLILNKAAGNGRKGGWWARSLSTVAAPGDIDLRKPAHAKRLEAILTAAALD
jgi:DNA invertase Pin-like site-specific DNA recombinase